LGARPTTMRRFSITIRPRRRTRVRTTTATATLPRQGPADRSGQRSLSFAKRPSITIGPTAAAATLPEAELVNSGVVRVVAVVRVDVTIGVVVVLELVVADELVVVVVVLLSVDSATVISRTAVLVIGTSSCLPLFSSTTVSVTR